MNIFLVCLCCFLKASVELSVALKRVNSLVSTSVEVVLEEHRWKPVSCNKSVKQVKKDPILACFGWRVQKKFPSHYLLSLGNWSNSPFFYSPLRHNSGKYPAVVGPVGLYNWLNHCQFPIMWPPWTVLFSKLVKNMQETRYLQTLSNPRAATINTRELNNGIINWEKCCSHIPGHSQTQKHTFCKFHTVQSPQLTLREFIAVKTISAPHYPATEEPLVGITIADVRQIAVTRFLTFLLTCLDCQKGRDLLQGTAHIVIFNDTGPNKSSWTVADTVLQFQPQQSDV